MNIQIPILQDMVLSISDQPLERAGYPTARLQKGLDLLHRGSSLAEEAVGFGVPVVKRGLQAVFPGSVALELLQQGPVWRLGARYQLNLVEKVARSGESSLKSRPLYAIKDVLAALIRRVPVLRAPLNGLSSSLRRIFGWETRYEPITLGYEVSLLYTVEPTAGRLRVESRASIAYPGDVTDLVLMNEQGARFFDCYRDSACKNLSGSEIGCWDKVTGAGASFVSSNLGISFIASPAAGAELFRGRELVANRLAWAGFGYVFARPAGPFEYTLSIEQHP